MNKITTALWASLAAVPGMAAIVVDTSPGTGAPPGTLGGYTMAAFPTDPSAEGDMITSLAPPASAPVTGDLLFSNPVEHMVVGPAPPHWWDTWSHGYTGNVYANEDSDLLMTLPAGTMAFYLYVQPNLKADFEFKVDSSATVVTASINGEGGAKYFGFYSNDPMDPLQFVYVRQTTMESDGFAVGEFGIAAVPEPQTWGLLAGLGLLGFAACRRSQRR